MQLLVFKASGFEPYPAPLLYVSSMNAHPSCHAQNTPRLFRLYTRSINSMREDKKKPHHGAAFYQLKPALAGVPVVMVFHAVMMQIMTDMAQMAAMMMQRDTVMGKFMTLFGNACSISLTFFMAQFAPVLMDVAHILTHGTLSGMGCLHIVMDVAFRSVGGGKRGDGKYGAQSNQNGFKHCSISCL